MEPMGVAADIANDAVLLSSKARDGIDEQILRMENNITESYGKWVGQILGDIYGGLFAKDLGWMFRAPTRVQRFPVLLVQDADSGSILARWIIGASMAFESELCKQTWPRVAPSITPAFTAGFQIGAAVGRNRAFNFKTLWVDGFFVSLVRQLYKQLTIKFQRLKGTSIRWDDVTNGLRDAVQRGQAARRLVLLRFGRLPTQYDQNAPTVLRLLPYHWVPDLAESRSRHTTNTIGDHPLKLERYRED